MTHWTHSFAMRSRGVAAIPNTHSADFLHGASQYARIVSPAAGVAVSGDFTFATWIKIRVGATEPDAFMIFARDKLVGGNSINYFWWYRNATLFIRARRSGGPDFNKNQAMNLGQGTWHHVATTWDQALDDLRFYFDGSPAGAPQSFGHTDPLDDRDGRFWMGRQNSAPDYMDGQLDEGQIWNRPLSPAEIATNYDKTMIGTEPGFRSYWRLNNDWLDTTGNGNTLTPGAAGQAPTFVADTPF